MSFARIVVPEVLDGLAANDPEAQRSRRDLQRIHRVMGTRGIVLRALRALPIRNASSRPLQILELGAGDGSLMLGVARALNGEWPSVALTFLDLIVANLFLHHFQSPELTKLLAAIAARSTHFFACEPRRAKLALAGSHLIGALGVNAVTREDAVLSVRAGFCGSELSALWPTSAPEWQLREYSAGLFSHCFIASRAASINLDVQPGMR